MDTRPWVLLVDDDAEFGRILEIYVKKLGVSLHLSSPPYDVEP